ncbi:MAG: phosphoribosyltransferase family protein [Patescibacteria group bacterium]|nr:phosphoribosyltransferase family protein [Patescibacteria group bacterium]
MAVRLKKIIELVFNIIFPPQCVNCKKKIETGNSINSAICKDCFSKMEIANCFYCPLCSRRLYEPKKSCHQETKFILAAATFYENNIIQNLIQALKYNNLKSAAKPLAEILKTYTEKINLLSLISAENFIVIPIPLYPKKQRRRGFNQITLIYKNLEQIISEKLPKIQENILLRVKNISSQTECANYDEREKNIKDSFIVKNPEIIKNKNVLLIDDVFTSGATLNEAVNVLKNSGAKKIIGLVIART